MMAKTSERPTYPGVQILDRLPPDWFVLGVMREKWPRWDWVIIMSNCPQEDHERFRRLIASDDLQGGIIRIPGKHRNEDAAWDAAQALLATWH
jgi:hypothetical protein